METEDITQKQRQFLIDTLGWREEVAENLTFQQAYKIISDYCKNPPATERQIEFLTALGATKEQLRQISKADANTLIKQLKDGETDGRSM